MSETSKGYFEVTSGVRIGQVDDESLDIRECICGHKFQPLEHVISIYSIYINDAKPMPCCGARLFFSNRVSVYKLEN